MESQYSCSNLLLQICIAVIFIVAHSIKCAGKNIIHTVHLSLEPHSWSFTWTPAVKINQLQTVELILHKNNPIMVYIRQMLIHPFVIHRAHPHSHKKWLQLIHFYLCVVPGVIRIFVLFMFFDQISEDDQNVIMEAHAWE